MSRGRFLYYERWDGVGVLCYPYEPFNLAVINSGKDIFVRPIIELDNGDCYFLYQGKKINPYDFELHPDEADPDWVFHWMIGVAQGKEVVVDISNLTGEYSIAFQAMLERKRKKINEWLSVK